MQEIFEKIIERLRENEQEKIRMYEWEGQSAILEAIEIVNQVAEEYDKPKLTPEQREACWAHSSKDCSTCGQCINSEISNMSENLASSDGWIPVSERLPDESGKYTVCTAKGSVYCAKFTVGKKDKFFHTDMYTHIIAWQPLPAPYKLKGEK